MTQKDTKERDPLLRALLGLKYVSPEQIELAEVKSRSSNMDIEKMLIKDGLIKKNDPGGALEEFYRVPYVDLDNTKISLETGRLLPEKIIRKYEAVPLSLKGGTLTVAMSSPNNVVALDYMNLITGYKINPVVTLKSGIRKFIETYYLDDSMDTEDEKSTFAGNRTEDRLSGFEIKDDGLKKEVVELLDILMKTAVSLRASDIHIEPQENRLFVRSRIDGILRTIKKLPPSFHIKLVSRIKILAGMDISEKRLPQDGRIRLTVKEREIDFRVSTLPGKYGEKVVMRVLDKSGFTMSMDRIGLLPEVQGKIENLISAPNGIILVTGPTGSGKTTTLYSALNKLKTTAKNIITLEDPVEYELLSGRKNECGITQVQVNSRIGLTFAAGLRASLRQDPDIILVGEIRDVETAKIAINSALTGHLVLSTLHTNDTASTIIRLMDMGIEPYRIAAALNGVLAQRLVRVLCHACRQRYSPPEKLLESMGLTGGDDMPERTFFRPVGCAECNFSGYRGRTAVFELMVIEGGIKKLITENAPLEKYRELEKEKGTVTLARNGMMLVSRGITSVAEVLQLNI